MLEVHRDAEHLDHLRRTRIIEGDIPHTLIALTYFDLGLYEPSRDTLAAILP